MVVRIKKKERFRANEKKRSLNRSRILNFMSVYIRVRLKVVKKRKRKKEGREIGKGKKKKKRRSADELKFSPSPFEKCGLVPAGRFRRRVNYTTRREKGKHVKKKRKKKEKREREKEVQPGNAH